MTEKELRKSVVDIAKSYLGTMEGSARHHEIVNAYNAYHDEYRRKYVLGIYDSWCMAFVSVCFIKAGLAKLIVTECGCGEAIARNSKYKKNFIERDDYVPSPGDIIMYDWQDTGKGDNTAWPDHTGIVESCDGYRIVVIEGNYSDMVKRRKISVNDIYIRGYIVPDFKSMSSDVTYDLKVTGNLRIRSTPETGKTIAVIPKGAKVKRISNPWVKVQYEVNGKIYEGWSSMKYLETV